jgi:flagellar capping protein FliD
MATEDDIQLLVGDVASADLSDIKLRLSKLERRLTALESRFNTLETRRDTFETETDRKFDDLLQRLATLKDRRQIA